MKLFSQKSLRWRISLIFFLSGLLLLALFIAFYTVTFFTMARKEAKYAFNMVTQITDKAEGITNSVDLLASAVSGSTSVNSMLRERDSTKKWNYRQISSLQISDLAKSNSHATSIVLLDNAGSVYGFNGFNYTLANELNSSYNLFSPDSFPAGFWGPFYSQESDIPYYATVHRIYDNRTPPSEDTVLGTCLVLGSCDQLLAACVNAAVTERSLYMILDSNDEVIVRNLEYASSLDASIIQSIHDREEQTFSVGIEGETYLINWQALEGNTGWKVVSAVPYREIMSDLTIFHLLAFLFLLVLLCIYFFLAQHIIGSITSPLETIIQFIQKGPQYSLQHRVRIKEQNELSILADQINFRLDQNRDLTTADLKNQAKLYEIEIANSQARLMSLQSQMNPHFLYNTLDAIQGLVYMERTQDIPKAISALSSIFRYSIKGDDIVEVQKELACVDKYLQIMKLRFEDRFTFRVEMDEEILSCCMPRFLLQPLVENAVFHGLEPKQGPGLLELKGTLLDGNNIQFTCSDNGIGMNSEKLITLQKQLETIGKQEHPAIKIKQNVGLYNVHLRLRILYGSPYGLSIDSSLQKGTVARIVFPAAQIKGLDPHQRFEQKN